MSRDVYALFRERTEDRLGEADGLDEAVRLALALAREDPTGDPILIEYGGLVVRQVSWAAGGSVEEEAGGRHQMPNQSLQRTAQSGRR
jgi:hypothetical protein